MLERRELNLEILPLNVDGFFARDTARALKRATARFSPRG